MPKIDTLDAPGDAINSIYEQTMPEDLLEYIASRQPEDSLKIAKRQPEDMPEDSLKIA